MTDKELQTLADAAFRGSLVANKQTLSVDESAMILGVSSRTIASLIQRGLLRVGRIPTEGGGAKKIVIDRADLLRVPQYGPAPTRSR